MIKKSLKKPTRIISWILAAVLAFLLWLNTTLDKKYDYTIQAPLKVIGLPPNIVPSAPIPEFVNINIQETGKNLFRFVLDKGENGVIVRIPLHNPVVGKNVIPIKKENIFWPADYSQPQHYLDNNEITLKLYPKTQKEVSVQVGFNPNIQTGYLIVGNTEIKPERVVARGPSYNLEKLDIANVIFESEKEFDDTLKIKLPLIANNIYNINFMPDSVLVTIPIQKEAVKMVESIPVRLINVPEHLEGKLLVNPSYATLEVRAGESIITDISAKDFNIFIDYSAIEPDSLGGNVTATVNSFKEIDHFKSFPQTFRIIPKER